MLIYETDGEYILEHEHIRIIAEKEKCPEDYAAYLKNELDKILNQPKIDIDPYGNPIKSKAQEPRLTEYSKWQLVREKRNRLLAESDWTQLPDSGVDSKTVVEWRRYRQQLREIPQRYARADDVVWPVRPDDKRQI